MALPKAIIQIFPYRRLMLSANSLTCVRGENELFHKVTFELGAGQCLFVRGENGSGKTSLLRILAGLLEAEEGEVLWNNQKIKFAENYNDQLAYLGHFSAIKSELSAIENICLSAQIDGIKIDLNLAINALNLLGLGERVHLPTRALSAGQKRRVLLTKLITHQKKIWILDEPFTALDVQAINFIVGLIKNHLQNQGILIITSHQDLKIDGFAVQELIL